MFDSPRVSCSFGCTEHAQCLILFVTITFEFFSTLLLPLMFCFNIVFHYYDIDVQLHGNEAHVSQTVSVPLDL